jgi:hypothetical protein
MRPAPAEFRFRPCRAAGFFLGLALLAGPVSAWAGAEVKTVGAAPVPRAKSDGLRTYVNLRAGVSAQSAGTGRANLCLETAPLDRFSIEACGNGSGFLDNDPTPELAHFRGYWKAAWWKKNDYVFTPRIGAGFAELQVGEDAPGFRFNGVDRNAASTSGPETLVSMQMRRPVGAGFEVVGDLQAGAAYLAHAPELKLPSTEVQPFAALTLGMGW